MLAQEVVIRVLSGIELWSDDFFLLKLRDCLRLYGCSRWTASSTVGTQSNVSFSRLKKRNASSVLNAAVLAPWLDDFRQYLSLENRSHWRQRVLHRKKRQQHSCLSCAREVGLVRCVVFALKSERCACSAAKLPS